MAETLAAQNVRQRLVNRREALRFNSANQFLELAKLLAYRLHSPVGLISHLVNLTQPVKPPTADQTCPPASGTASAVAMSAHPRQS
jgi:hypothetical protein